ncbi:cytochrome c oxidase subunit 3 family protein [Motiliproteus coralliicola]|nr:cytochrome c oxidase subunit 3 family protein [Motiliproteus coralliicola]
MRDNQVSEVLSVDQAGVALPTSAEHSASANPDAASDAITKPKPGRVPGNKAVWFAIYTEMTEFGVMFLIYFIAKVHSQEMFDQGPQQLNTLAGTLNTLAMLSSSFCVARAMVAIRRDAVRESIRWLWGTIGCVLFYLVVKIWEYLLNAEHGFSVYTNLFFTVYYYLTFNHFIHVIWGGGAILWVIIRLHYGAYSAKDHEGMEAVACYWHMIDLVWIVIFPLVYVLR